MRACARPPTSSSPAARDGSPGAPTPPNTFGPPTRAWPRRRPPPPRGPRPMTAAPPETLTLDRVPTPIGVALVVTDEAGVLRAFNWTDYEPAVLTWIGRRYPKARLVEGEGPLRATFDAYFAGQTDAFETIAWEGAGTAFQRQVWAALCTIPAGETWS